MNNQQFSEHNVEALNNLKSPILKINAEQSTDSDGHPDKIDKYLSLTFFLAINAKIMILCNIDTSLGLVNAATGIIKEFIHNNGEVAPCLPYANICESRDCKGQPSSSGLGK